MLVPASHLENAPEDRDDCVRVAVAGLPEKLCAKLLAGLNAARLYNFDLEELKARAAKVGPTLTFYDKVWPKFLRDNARKVLKLGA